MTIIVGIICKDDLVVGSDCQTSKTTSETAKRLDSDKISVITFRDGLPVLVAESGACVITQRLIEIMMEDAKRVDTSGYREPADCAQRAVNKLKAEILIPLMPQGRSAEEIQDIYNSYDASLLIAYYHNKEPFLYSIDFSIGSACREKKYALLGCGSNVAELMTSWFDFSQMSWAQAIVTVGFIIGEVKKVDAMCGGPTKIKSIKLSTGEVRTLSAEKLQSLEDEVEVGARRYKSEWESNILKIVNETIKRWQKTK